MTPVMPKTWNSGSTASTRSGPVPTVSAQDLICAVLAVMLAWVRSAAFGEPVVPPVYCMTAMSRSGSTATAAGMPSLSISLLNRVWAASFGVTATSRRLNSMNNARLVKGRARPMPQTTSFSRQVSSSRRATLG